MRRPQSNALSSVLLEDPPETVAQLPGLWRANFALRSITPILGGGVRSFEPDVVDIVRAPAIRGQLRWWWRTLFENWSDEHDSPAADALFAREAKLWGGVGVPGAGGSGGKERPGLRCRVGLAVEIISAGDVVAAGFHERRDDGRLRPMPSWKIGQGLGYAIFPLQRSEKERRQFERENARGSMATRYVRTAVRFRLQVALSGSEPGVPPPPAEAVEVLASLWAWLHFGGLGARTRRGFGALETAERVSLDALPGLDLDSWQRLFEPPPELEVLAWLELFGRLASPRGRAWPPVILLGSAKRDASGAHQEIVDGLRAFRQEPQVGRDAGNPRPGQRRAQPGPSRWPEPHLLRSLAPPGAAFTTHPPPPEIVRQVEAGEVGAPRAAFGLPIQVQFKDADDKRANATLLPSGAQRWPSPLLVRPLRTASGGYCPAAVVLTVPPPREVEIEYASAKGAKKRCSVRKSAGARALIAQHLEAANGNALEAFAGWLVKKGYQRIAYAAKGGNSRV